MWVFVFWYSTIYNHEDPRSGLSSHLWHSLRVAQLTKVAHYMFQSYSLILFDQYAIPMDIRPIGGCSSTNERQLQCHGDSYGDRDCHRDHVSLYNPDNIVNSDTGRNNHAL